MRLDRRSCGVLSSMARRAAQADRERHTPRTRGDPLTRPVVCADAAPSAGGHSCLIGAGVDIYIWNVAVTSLVPQATALAIRNHSVTLRRALNLHRRPVSKLPHYLRA